MKCDTAQTPLESRSSIYRCSINKNISIIPDWCIICCEMMFLSQLLVEKNLLMKIEFNGQPITVTAS